jgi:hypothetical protein
MVAFTALRVGFRRLAGLPAPSLSTFANPGSLRKLDPKEITELWTAYHKVA